MNFVAHLRALFRRRRREADMSAELQAHLDALTDRHVAAGLSPEEARYAALREFGGVEQIKELCRDERALAWLDDFVRDVRHALRHFRRSPAFAMIAILSLGVAIGANTSIFTLLNSVLFRPVPAANPEELVLLRWTAPKWPAPFSQTGSASQFSFSYPAFERLLQADSGLRDLFAVVPAGLGAGNLTVLVDGNPVLANGLMVTGNYFPGLRVAMQLGRGIRDADVQHGPAEVVVISDAFWASQFNRDPGVLGRTVVVNNVPCAIVGVASADFDGFVAAEVVPHPDLWVPFSEAQSLRPWGMAPHGSHSMFSSANWICLNLVGRVPPGRSAAAITAHLDSVFQSFVRENWPGAKETDLPTLGMVPCGYGLAGIKDQVSMPLTVLMTGVGLLLVVACANLATLLLARAQARQRELAVRVAVGASRARLVRQLLTESLFLSACGGLVGLLIACWGNALLARMLGPGATDLPIDLRMDTRAFAFATVIAMATGVAFGLAPGLRGTHGASAGGVNIRSTGGVDRASARLGRLLLAGQLSLSLLLLVCAALFGRTLRNMEQRDLGYDASHLLVFGVDPTRAGYAGEKLRELYDEIRANLAAVPGVSAVTLIENRPFTGSNNGPFRVVGSGRVVKNPVTRWETVGPDFCTTLGARLVGGRDISIRDTSTGRRVAIVNEEFVDEFFGDAPALGREFTGPSGDAPFEIVGIVRDLELVDLHARPMPKAFVPYAQLSSGRLNAMYFEVRTAGDPLVALPSIRLAVANLARGVPLLDVATQSKINRDAMFAERLFARLATFFGLAAVLVASIGLYGTVAYQVSRRVTEIGIRMALGSTPRAVVTFFLRQSLPVLVSGGAIGILLSLFSTRTLRGLLYDVAPVDPMSFVIAASLLLAVALLASWLPARRATRINPVEALRAE
jgi:predicted permease